MDPVPSSKKISHSRSVIVSKALDICTGPKSRCIQLPVVSEAQFATSPVKLETHRPLWLTNRIFGSSSERWQDAPKVVGNKSCGLQGVHEISEGWRSR